MPVSGALTQIAAQGPQNRYLTIDPQITFWKGTVKRATMFAVAEIENNFTGQTGTGKKMVATVNRTGDLLWRTYFYFQLDPIQYNTSMLFDGFQNNVAYYTNAIGHAIVEAINYEVGGHQFDETEGAFLDIWEQVSSTYGHRLGPIIGQADSIEQLIEFGKTTQHIYTPLEFDWCRFTQSAFPLIALQYHDMKINIRTRESESLIVRCGEANNPATLAQPGQFKDMKLIMNYVFLEDAERRSFTQTVHEYIVSEVQHSGGDSHQSGQCIQSFRIDANHPIIEQFWIIQKDTVIQPLPYTGPGNAAGGGGNDWFNYSGNYDPVTGILYDPIMKAELLLNGHSRTLDHPAIYYRKVQPRERHTRQPDGFIYNYSYSLCPEDRQPSGSCNYSRIDNVNLRLTFPSPYNADSSVQAQPFNATVRIYERSYNVIRVASGMAGKIYAN
jgi:hypothetical protein